LCGADRENLVPHRYQGPDRTRARLAALTDEGRLPAGTVLRHDSIVGSTFTGRVPETVDVAGHRAVIPQVTGMAYRTGEHVFSIDHTTRWSADSCCGEVPRRGRRGPRSARPAQSRQSPTRCAAGSTPPPTHPAPQSVCRTGSSCSCRRKPDRGRCESRHGRRGQPGPPSPLCTSLHVQPGNGEPRGLSDRDRSRLGGNFARLRRLRYHRTSVPDGKSSTRPTSS
jgi:Proline racemase